MAEFTPDDFKEMQRAEEQYARDVHLDIEGLEPGEIVEYEAALDVWNAAVREHGGL